MKIKLSELRELIREELRKAYEILGVSPTASQEEIKKAWRKKAMALHPDRNPNKDTSDAIKKVNIAFGLLSIPSKRMSYDKHGDTTLGDTGSSFGPATHSARTSSPTRYFIFKFSNPERATVYLTIKRDGPAIITTFGYIGSSVPPKTKTVNYTNAAEALTEYIRSVVDCKKSGYVETTAEEIKK